jgi:hypothetical protein
MRSVCNSMPTNWWNDGAMDYKKGFEGVMTVVVVRPPQHLKLSIMPDSSLVPAFIQTKSQFWEHVISQLSPLLDGQRDWVSTVHLVTPPSHTLPCLLTASSSASPAYYIQVTNLANTTSLVYHSLLSYPAFGDGPSSVNWCGELSPLFDLDHTSPPHGRSQVPRGPRVANWKKKSDPEFPKITYTSFRILHRLLFISDSKD